MRRLLLVSGFAILVFALTLTVVAGSGLKDSQPVPDARATPTSIVPIPPQDRASPESPETPLLPDLIVEEIRVAPSSPAINWKATVFVTIRNRGLVDVDPGNNFWCDLYIDPGVVPIQLGQDGEVAWPSQSVWVPAGGSYVLQTEWVFDDVKNYVLYAQVDTDGHVAESNENNNVLGPVNIEVRAPDQLIHETHQEFQLGVASSLDASHPEGVLRRGIFWEPSTEPGVYSPDVQVDNPPDPPSHPNNVNQSKPALAGDGSGTLFAAWEDGRNGGVYNRDIYFSRSDNNGTTWGVDLRVNDDAVLPFTANQVSPDLFYDQPRDRVYVAWQDERDGDFDIYFRAYDVASGSFAGSSVLVSDDSGTANQRNPSLAMGPAGEIYVVWQDHRNGNDDIYIARSDDGGLNWSRNYFVGDDPDMTPQLQAAPSVDVDAEGNVFVAWEDWRDPVHPEIYVMWSLDRGQTFGVDVPISIVEPEARNTHRIEPSLVVQTSVEVVEYPPDPPLHPISYTESATITAVHVAWQDGIGDDGDIYWAYAVFDYNKPELCPWPYDFCFKTPQEVSGAFIDSAYVRPPDEAPAWPIEPSWQGQVTIAGATDNDWTYCKADSTITYTKGIFLAWSDARSYDDWRYEIRTRRVASPEGNAKSFQLCEDQFFGMVNSNAKIYEYRDDLASYEIFKPAATRQLHPYLFAAAPGAPTFQPQVSVVWDDDRHDVPLEPNSVRNHDIFFTRWEIPPEGIYISPVIDSRAESIWYALSWWGSTQHFGDLLFQTRIGTTPNPPQDDVAANGWTRWSGNPSTPYPGCPGEGCYYDAAGRHIVDAAGSEWPVSRYIQYKVLMKELPVASRITAVSRVTLHYDGPDKIYLPLLVRGN